MEWKKMLKASLIPVALIFLIYAITEPMYDSLPGYSQFAFGSNFYFGYLLAVLIIFISGGYAAVRIYHLDSIDLIASGILTFLFFIAILALIPFIFHCTSGRPYNKPLFGILDACPIYHSDISPIIFGFLWVCGVTIGWSLALTLQKTKPEEKPVIKKPSKQKE